MSVYGRAEASEGASGSESVRRESGKALRRAGARSARAKGSARS